jgi:hypothetical protein
MNSRRLAYVSAITLASCVLLLVALAIGGTHPAATGNPTSHVADSSASQSRYLTYSFSSSLIGSAPSDNSAPLVVILALITFALVVLALIIRQILRRGFDRNGFLMLLGLAAAIVLAFEMLSANYASAPRPMVKTHSPPLCEGRGSTIEVLAGDCRFEANGSSSWTLSDDLLPTDLEFETAVGEAALVSANSNQPQYAVGVSKCLTLSCNSQHNLSFVVFLGTSTKQDRARDFTRTTRFADTAPGRSGWLVSILTYLPHHKGTTSRTPRPKAKRGFDWRAFIEALSAAMLVGVVLAIVGPTVIRRLRRRRGGTGDDKDVFDNPITMVESDRDQLLVAANEVLDEETDPRTAILRCWLELERLLDSLGLAREPSETADELTTRLIHSGSTTRQELIALHDLFITARYSTRPIGESDRDNARALLGQLRASFAEADIPLVAQDVT